MRKQIVRLCLASLIIACLAPGVRPLAAPQGIVVGDGASASCHAAALANAVAVGGAITFNCGPAPWTIVTDEITIGAGQQASIDGGNRITLSGGHANRLFHVQPGATLALRALTLADGAVIGSGGAILSEGNLTLDQVTLRDNQADGDPTVFAGSGGALFAQGGSVEVLSSRFIDNHALTDSGGALVTWLGADGSQPTITIADSRFERNTGANGSGAAYLVGVALIEDSTFVSNIAPAGGAIIYSRTLPIDGALASGPAADFILRRSTVSANRAETHWGGGILLVGARTRIEQSAITGNFSQLEGGGIQISGGWTTIEDSELTGNESQTNGGGLFVDSTYYPASPVTVTSSLIAGNRAAGVGGGVAGSSAEPLRFSNVTFSGNHAGQAGGGVHLGAGLAILTHVTQANNEAPAGAALALGAGATLTLAHSIVSSPASAAACLLDASAALLSGGANIASDDSCTLSGSGDLAATDPLLAALADNGGPTLTHLPQPGSPALDRASLEGCPARDQRGFVRPVGVACDTGAVEVGAVAPTPTLTPTSSPTASPTPAPPTPTPAPPAEPEPLPAALVLAQPPDALAPTIQINPSAASPGAAISVSGVNAPGSTAVRLQWTLGGAMLFAANEASEPGGAYNVEINVPDEGIVGPARLCAAALDISPAAFACADFTIEPPAAGEIEGQIALEALPPANTRNSVRALPSVRLLNQAGATLVTAPVNTAGQFTMNNIAAGNYQLAVGGALSRPVALTPVTVIGGGIIRPTLLPYLAFNRFDPVDGLVCDNNDAAAAWVSAKYAYAGAVSGQALQSSAEMAPLLLANRLLLNDLHSFRLQQTFGIYLSRVPLVNEFTAEMQTLSDRPIVAVNYRIVAAGVTRLDVNVSTAPYAVSFDMGALPAGRHKLYVAPIVQTGPTTRARQCPLEKEILVANSPANLVSGAANQQISEVNVGFDPAVGQYYFDVTTPPYRYSVPNQPTNYPYIGDLQNVVSATARLSGRSSLSGACTLSNAYLRGSVQVAGEYFCSPFIDLRAGNRACIIDPLNPGKTTFDISGRTICSNFIDKVRYENDLFNFLDLVRVRLKIGLRLDARANLTSRVQPFTPYLLTNVFADAQPGVYGSVRLSFLRVINAHARLTANGTAFIQPRVTRNASGQNVQLSGCAAAQLYLTLWIESIIGPQHFKLTEVSECVSRTVQEPQALTLVAANEVPLDPGPRVWAAPALASAPDGRMLSVIVEDTTPAAPEAAPAIFARFWDPAAQAWGEAVQVSGNDRLVNDPVVTFYGADGQQALVAWSQIEMTPAERAAAGNDLNAILARQEIFYARWDGSQWLVPQRLTDDLAADGLASMAGDVSGATLAWTSDRDGNIATTLDSVIAVVDWDGATQSWDAPAFLSAGDGATVVTAAARSAQGTAAIPAAGLNYDVAVDRAYYAARDRSRTVIALTFDADGDFNTGDDRTVRVFQRDLDAVQLDPQPLPPREWTLVNPQPLPPRIQSPTLALDRNDMNAIRLAFLQADAAGGEGGVAVIDQPATLWDAELRRTLSGWQSAAALLLDGQAPVLAEQPRILSGPDGQSTLVFRRFSDESAVASVGQIAVSSGIIIEGGRTAFGDPVYLTGSPGVQQWMPAATLNPATNALHVSSVQHALSLGSGARASLAAASMPPTIRLASVRAALLSAATDPVVALTLGDQADPALEGTLTLDRIHAPLGTTVHVTARGRNLGRRAADITVHFWRGTPGGGIAVGQTAVGIIAAGEPFSATIPLTVEAGDQPIYAVVVADGNTDPSNDLAIGNLAAMPAPEISALDNEGAPARSLLLALTQPAAEDLAGFRLLRGPTPHGPFGLLAETTEPLYLDRGLTDGVTYCYQAQVYDARGNLSPLSEPVCATAVAPHLFLPIVYR